MTAPLLLGVALAGTVTTAFFVVSLFTRRGGRDRSMPRAEAPIAVPHPQAPHAGAAVLDRNEPFQEDDSPSEVVRFDVHVFFAERRETHLIVDVLADLADGRGGVFGVPACLILSRPPNPLAETLLLSLMEETEDQRCQVEVDLAIERASVKVRPAGRELSIPIRAASGLPLAS